MTTADKVKAWRDASKILRWFCEDETIDWQKRPASKHIIKVIVPMLCRKADIIRRRDTHEKSRKRRKEVIANLRRE